MLKNILKLDGAQQLSKNEQKEINGAGPRRCNRYTPCTGPAYPNTIWVCVNYVCMPELLSGD